ncbi:hypothetical protein HPB50_017984 [Hyalomma asiaticum]|uniref:Uncharacterized protein n=1 Tax=Hyalomma asiaticum TaxID=266040 RepID=A0ACB7T863_HYAAI|nr:hypothetical protein HPB50_017984 [Hyalomma asiaticum]
MALAKYFSGSRIKCRTVGPNSERRMCRACGDIPLWNGFFWQVGLELKELSPGQLSLVEMDDPHVTLDMCEDKNDAAVALHNLLTCHGCVVSVDLNAHTFKDCHRIICQALRNSASLRKLKLCQLPLALDASWSFTRALPHMNQLQELEFRETHLDRTSIAVFSEFLARTRSLTTLVLTRQNMEHDDALVVVQGLRRNVTLTTLSLNTSFLTPVSSECAALFGDYLSENQTLRALSVKSRYRNAFVGVRLIIGALLRNNTIAEVNLSRFSLDVENMKLVASFLSQNWSLRRFHMVDCFLHKCELQYRLYAYVHPMHFALGTSLIDSWLVALAENKTLAQLSLDMSLFNADDCWSFFKALARNTSLKKVIIHRFERKDIAEIFRALRETGVHERCLIGTHLVHRDTVGALSECKELSSIVVDTSKPRGIDMLSTTLDLLPTFSRLKSLSLKMYHTEFNENVSLIAPYIAETSVLRELSLTVEPGRYVVEKGAERRLLEALYANRSIQKLSMHSICVCEKLIPILLDTLQSSRTLFDLTFHPRYPCQVIFLMQELSRVVSSNFTLLGMHVRRYRQLRGHLFEVMNVALRNLSLVTRAAHFVTGTRDRYCASAVELVHFHPALVTKVQELASVEEGEATSWIRSSLKSFSDLDEFMRLAGVVRRSVTCHDDEGGETQLVDLNTDCWLHLRQYLKLSDILDAQ